MNTLPVDASTIGASTMEPSIVNAKVLDPKHGGVPLVHEPFVEPTVLAKNTELPVAPTNTLRDTESFRQCRLGVGGIYVRWSRSGDDYSQCVCRRWERT